MTWIHPFINTLLVIYWVTTWKGRGEKRNTQLVDVIVKPINRLSRAAPGVVTLNATSPSVNTLLLPVTHPQLTPYLQSILFFRRTTLFPFQYTTFPNTNVCLALYKNNHVSHTLTPSSNHCQIDPGTNQFTSRLYGFHKRAFTVSILAPLDQICILFRAGGLRAFTAEPFSDLAASSQVVYDLFSHRASTWLEQLFETDEPAQRASLIEAFLLRQLQTRSTDQRIQMLLPRLQQNPSLLTMGRLATDLGVHASTLYRLFMDQVGQSPKAYAQTLRFRQSLTHLLARSSDSLTQLAYAQDYFDQAHFGHHLKQTTGYAPGQLTQKLTVEHQELIWITHANLPA